VIDRICEIECFQSAMTDRGTKVGGVNMAVVRVRRDVQPVYFSARVRRCGDKEPEPVILLGRIAVYMMRAAVVSHTVAMTSDLIACNITVKRIGAGQSAA